ncbi:uncharacterized [Tachysurus ichikawai]
MSSAGIRRTGQGGMGGFLEQRARGRDQTGEGGPRWLAGLDPSAQHRPNEAWQAESQGGLIKNDSSSRQERW